MAMDYTNFYTVYYWMSKLKTKKVVKGGIKMEPLAGVAKDLYALIFRFSHGKNGCCNMSYKTMEDVTGVPKSTLIRNLKLLEESNLIQNSFDQIVLTNVVCRTKLFFFIPIAEIDVCNG